MARRRAIARRMPISCVRSLTRTSMMLLTPTMPASSVPRPTIHVRRPIPPEEAVDLGDELGGGHHPGRLRVVRRDDVAREDGLLDGAFQYAGRQSLPPTAASMWIVLPMPNICCTSVAGRTIVRSTSLKDIIWLWRFWTPMTVNCVPCNVMISPVGSSPPGKKVFPYLRADEAHLALALHVELVDVAAEEEPFGIDLLIVGHVAHHGVLSLAVAAAGVELAGPHHARGVFHFGKAPSRPRCRRSRGSTTGPWAFPCRGPTCGRGSSAPCWSRFRPTAHGTGAPAPCRRPAAP